MVSLSPQVHTPPAEAGPTDVLYDQGEELWERKYHLGCGGIYLQGYTNVDAAGILAGEADAAQLAGNKTDIRNYYARLDWSPASHIALPQRRPTICDVRADLLNWQPGGFKAWDKIVAIQVLEHFSPVDALYLLEDWYGKLGGGRPLVLSVPDMFGTLRLLESGDTGIESFALRHLRGSGRDEWNWHKAWYQWPTLAELLQHAGFSQVTQLRNFHAYPAICVRALA